MDNNNEHRQSCGSILYGLFPLPSPPLPLEVAALYVSSPSEVWGEALATNVLMHSEGLGHYKTAIQSE